MKRASVAGLVAGGFTKVLNPDLAVAVTDPLVSRQFLQPHRTAPADLVGADADFGAHAKFAAVGEASGGIPINGGGIDFVEELFCARRVLCDDEIGRASCRERV